MYMLECVLKILVLAECTINNTWRHVNGSKTYNDECNLLNAAVGSQEEMWLLLTECGRGIGEGYKSGLSLTREDVAIWP
jgi:hypothetical protein